MTRRALFLLLPLAACAAPHPPLVSSEVVVPATWRTPIGGGGAVEAGWWRGFDDPALSALVERALANNLDIGTAVARVREARAAERLARAQLFPTLDAGVGVTTGRTLSPFGTGSDSIALQPVFQSAYELDLFGRVGSQVEASRLNALGAAAAADAARLSVAAATASGYLTLRGLDARIATVRATIASRAEALRLARSRARVGYTSELELRQAEAEYEGVAQTLPQLELAATRQENALGVLTGAVPGAIARGLTLSALRAPPVPDGLPSDLLRRRPDIAQAELALAASDRSLAAARAQFLPTIRLTGSSGLALSSALVDPVTLFSLGASVLAPLFEGGRLRAGVETAASRRDQAALAYRRTALVAFREVDDALAAVDRLRVQRDHLDRQRRALAEALRHATNRYRAGYSSYLEQLDAQRSLFNVELALAQTATDQLTALVALFQALGGGWTGVTTGVAGETVRAP